MVCNTCLPNREERVRENKIFMVPLVVFAPFAVSFRDAEAVPRTACRSPLSRQMAGKFSRHTRALAFPLCVKSRAGTAIAAVSTVATRKPV